ncbi:MAG: hypothetical protein BWY85_02416 [Firmicutes bacterium ADurb.Bin506]|nr:MAG: hypothetical protein BWY85_02416 [Firmicutes bacterium ADurb.Bin506]
MLPILIDTTGSTACLATLPMNSHDQPMGMKGSLMPYAGKTGHVNASRRVSIIAIQKAGRADTTIADDSRNVSRPPPRRQAAVAPSATPSRSDTRNDDSVNARVQGILDQIT